MISFHSSVCGDLVSPTPFVKRGCLSSNIYFWHLCQESVGLCLNLTFHPIGLQICFYIHIMSILLTLQHNLESGVVIPLALLIVRMGYICVCGGQKTFGTLLCQILTQPGPSSPSDHPAPYTHTHTHTHTPWH